MSVVNSDASVELAKTLEWIREGANQAGAWALEQAPLLAQEFIRWEITAGVLLAVLGLAGMLLALFCWIGAYYSRDNEGGFGWFVIGTLVGLMSLIPMTQGIAQATKAYVAPRVVIVEKIHELVK